MTPPAVALCSVGQNVNDAFVEHVFDLAGVGGHVRCFRMGHQILFGLPLLDNHESVGAKFCLNWAHAVGVNHRIVLDASLLSVDGWYIFAECLQDFGALAGLGGDHGDDVNHRALSVWGWNLSRRS